ncbi:MAG: glucosyl transferase [Ignavibacteriales bacterium]|nr:glucosyl transferase [Ignavibacteriales bacterium]
MKSKIMNILLIFLITSILSCNTTEPNGTKTISLTVEDVSCTEAWLKISGAAGSSLILKRDDKEIKNIILRTADTTVVDDSLQPDKSYAYQALIKTSSVITEGSPKVTATTMDTTSHNFTWQTFTFGSGVATSDLKDVAIIDKNNIWAVGAIYLKDSIGNPDPQAYNAVHWDGVKWELKKIPFYYQGTPFYGPIYSIYSFGENDIWFGIGNMIHFDGKNYNSVIIPGTIFQSIINKIWGNEDYLYIVGNDGNIARYNRKASVGGWQKIETGTDLDISDIWGNNDNIICVAGKDYQSFRKEIFLIDGSTIKRKIKNDELYFLRSLWFKNKYRTMFVGTSIFNIDNILNDTLIKEVHIDRVNYALNSIRGNGANDIFTAGAFGEILHYNGGSWESYIDQTHINGNYYKIAVKGDLVVAVGLDNPNAVVAMGIRNK